MRRPRWVSPALSIAGIIGGLLATIAYFAKGNAAAGIGWGLATLNLISLYGEERFHRRTRKSRDRWKRIAQSASPSAKEN